MPKPRPFPPLEPEIDPYDRAAVCERLYRLKSPFAIMGALPPGWSANLTRAGDRTWTAVIHPPDETFPPCSGHKDDRKAFRAALLAVFASSQNQVELQAA